MVAKDMEGGVERLCHHQRHSGHGVGASRAAKRGLDGDARATVESPELHFLVGIATGPRDPLRHAAVTAGDEHERGAETAF